MSDRRDRARNRTSPLQNIDRKRMTAEFDNGEDEPITVHLRFEVCDLCDGKGSHVNPSIDAHGLSREDFDEDPDFAEDYFSGRYDVPCYECDGNNVVPVPDPARNTPEVIAAIEEWEADQAAYARECEAERRMGA